MTHDPTTPRLDVYRALAGAPRAPAGRGAEAVLDPIDGRVRLLSSAEASVLSACAGAATLDEHAARAEALGFKGTRAAIVAMLRDLVDRGVLVREADLVRRFRAAEASSAPDARSSGARVPEEAPAPRVEMIGIPTRDRPRMLRRALASHAADLVAHGRSIEIVVADRSESEALAAEARAASREVAASTGVTVRHLDASAIAAFVEALWRLSAAPAETLGAALYPDDHGAFAAGASRNVLLLLAAGRCALQVDDDTIGDARAAPGARPGLRGVSSEDPTEMWIDDGAAPEERPVGGHVGAHEALLGRRARELFTEDGADLGSASAAMIGRALRGGHVRCTQAGLRGDPALGTMMFALTIGAPTRARLLASEAVYRRAITSRRLVRAAPMATITEREGCMTAAVGLDARGLLPPFPGIGRNEDGLFGHALAACDEAALFGHLPWTLAHEPESARAQPFEHVFEHAGRIGENDLLAALITSSLPEIDRRSQAAAIESLGHALVAWSELPEHELFERAWWMLGRRLAQRLARIESLLREERRTPPYWARDLDRLADTIRERAEDPERAIPYDLRERMDASAARRAFRERLLAYGDVAIHWSAMWDAARELHARGDRFGEVLR
ncbi:MAG: hypothetical protein U0441_33525 [Polyangiaceae bacterium]